VDPGAPARGRPTAPEIDRPAPTSKERMSDKKKRLTLSIVWRESRELMWAHRRSLGIGMALMLVSRVAGLVLPGTTKILIDDVIGKQRADLLVPVALAAAGATAVQAATSFGLTQVVSIAAQRAITDMRKRVQAHITRLPIRYYDSTRSGTLISRIMTDAEGIRNLVGTGIVQLCGGVVTAVLAFAVLIYINWTLTLITLSILAVSGALMSYAFSYLRPIFRERWKVEGEITGRLSESLGGARIVKAYVAERREQLVFARGAHSLLRLIARTLTGISATTAMSMVVVGVIGVIMILIGGRAMLDGRMTIGDFVMYISFTAMMAAPLVEMANVGTQIAEAFSGLDRIREIFSVTPEDEGDEHRAAIGPVKGDIRFENVTFEYTPGVEVLKGISFAAPAGSTTALVGSSGSGKSTLIGLVMALHRPKSGRIVVDGHDLSDLRIRSYRSQLGVVLQDNFLFDGTVRENIAFSRPNASLDEVRRVAHIAHVDEFVDRFENRYDTIVGERGVKLSGGQRQRVAIARAILADPRVLILDEATSSLDSESEAMIQDGLQRLQHGRTTFVIAHRLSTIRNADQILVLEGGEIVERGTHPELIEKNGRYRELYDRQYAIEINRFINPGEDFTPEPQRDPVPMGRTTA
jgi:subfamily B ATP-binding cassette protein MsbA